jgi:CDGSH-type Zn-finger protein
VPIYEGLTSRKYGKNGVEKKEGAMNMEKPEIPQKSPIPVELKKGDTYYWCTCGKSDKQPFCDGSHEGTSFEPLAFTAEKDEKAYLCACKHTKNPPYCDGSHEAL